jgi:hypothetical protein
MGEDQTRENTQSPVQDNWNMIDPHPMAAQVEQLQEQFAAMARSAGKTRGANPGKG